MFKRGGERWLGEGDQSGKARRREGPPRTYVRTGREEKGERDGLVISSRGRFRVQTRDKEGSLSKPKNQNTV